MPFFEWYKIEISSNKKEYKYVMWQYCYELLTYQFFCISIALNDIDDINGTFNLKCLYIQGTGLLDNEEGSKSLYLNSSTVT